LLVGAEATVFDQRLVCPCSGVEYPSLEPRLFSFNDPLGACPTCEGTGLAPGRTRGAAERPCPTCHGTRREALARGVRVGGKNIAELSALGVDDLAAFMAGLDLPGARRPEVRLVLDQIRARLAYLAEVDLGYLTLDRAARTLSTGEAQRVRLTT